MAAEPRTSTLLQTWHGTVKQDWVDYNSHMRDAFYLLVFSYATDALMQVIDLGESARNAHQTSLYTLETHLNYLHEIKQGEWLHVESQLLFFDQKRIRLFHYLYTRKENSQELCATNEQTLLHVDQVLAKSCAFRSQTLACLEQLFAQHQALPKPLQAGRSITLGDTPAADFQRLKTGHLLTTPLEGMTANVWDAEASIPAPLSLCRFNVKQEWVDYNGHMSESCFLLVFGDNSDAFFRYIGIDERYRNKNSLFTVQTMMFNLKEVALHDLIHLSLQLLDADTKRIHLFHQMLHGETGVLLATAEQMLVHVDIQSGRSAPMSEALIAKVTAIVSAHAHLPKPAQVGMPIRIRR